MNAVCICRLRKASFPSKEGLIRQHFIKLGNKESRKAICLGRQLKKGKCSVSKMECGMEQRRSRFQTDRAEPSGKV